jgi:hypothetical protein
MGGRLPQTDDNPRAERVSYDWLGASVSFVNSPTFSLSVLGLVADLPGGRTRLRFEAQWVAYPLAVAPELVGTYAIESGSGAGYFYDDVLEYRVWVDPERGGERLSGGSDYFEAFAQWERAEEFSKTHTGTEEPLALVRQHEWIREPEPGHYIWEKTERITEWQTRWLDGHKRTEEVSPSF